MHHRHPLRFGALAVIGTLLFVAPAFSFAQSCGGLNMGCCLTGAACQSGLMCRQGLCVEGGQGAGGGESISLPNPFGPNTNTLQDVIAKVLTVLRDVGAPIAGVMVVVGGFQMLFSGGDSEKFATGRKTILYTAVGYAIILLASGVATFIRGFLA